MDFQKAVTLSGKVYNFLKKFNLENHLKLDEIIDNYYPEILSRLQNYSKTAKIAISSTNGKKTTLAFLNRIFEENNQTTISNIEKETKKIPVLTSIILELLKSQEPRDYYSMIFEYFELAPYFNSMRFDYLLLNNLINNQRDLISFEEKKKFIQNAIILNPKLNLIVNADDASLFDIDEIKNDVISSKKRKKILFGFNNVEFYNNAENLGQRNDILKCPNCGCDLVFDKHFYSHLGHYNCECGFRRPKPDIEADATIFPNYLFLNVFYKDEKYAFKMPVGDLYNAYNALGAIAVALELNIPRKIIALALAQCNPIKNRNEVLTIKNKNIKIKLAQNSASLSENLRELYHSDKNYKVVLCLNDALEDGIDTSWIWDSNFSAFRGFENKIYVSGNRFDDMALRLKYAGVNPSLIIMEQSVSHAIECCFWDLTEGENMLIILTPSLIDSVEGAVKKCLQ